MSRVLIIGDTHIPFEKKGYIEFCVEIKKKWKCNKVVHIGDLVDNHSISYHEHDPDGLSPEDEMRLADEHLKAWYKAFPKVFLCRGNHDSLVDRKTRTSGLPSRVLRPFRDMWQLPNGWVDDWDFVIDDVLYKHGLGFSGRRPHALAAIDAGCSVVIGHLHSVLGMEYIFTDRSSKFGMSVGCGIDRRKYAFRYGKDMRYKPAIGCGVVIEGETAIVCKMDLK